MSLIPERWRLAEWVSEQWLLIVTGFVVRGYVTCTGSAQRCCWISHPCVCVCVCLNGDGTNNARSEGMNPSARGAQLTKLTEVWDNIVVVTDWPRHMIGTMNFKEWNILRASTAASIFKQVCKLSANVFVRYVCLA